jgi:Holliday junction resolvasome RuvABC endonuclease subunit
MYLVGLDISLRSPGWVVIDEVKKVIHLFGLRQRVSDPLGMFCGLCKEGYTFKFTLLFHPSFHLSSDTVANRTTIYQYISMAIMSSLVLAMPEHKVRPVHVLIENYVYGAVGSQAIHLLCELGGLIRTHIHATFPQAVWVEKMAVSIKKSFTGSGRAKKKDMINEYHRRGYPELPSSSHPWEDMVDALAMALCLRDNLVKPAISFTSQSKLG